MAGIPDLEAAQEAEIELSLGLSIGGSYRKNPPVSISFHDWSPSDRSPSVDRRGSEGGGEADLVDQKRRREMNARRRREARRKRGEEKSLCRGGVSVNSSDRMAMEAQGFHCRAGDRTAREADMCRSDRRKSREDPSETLELATPNPNFGGYQVPGFSMMPALAPAPLHFPFHPMQCMPVPNGFHYPYLAPFWGPPPSRATGGSLNSAASQSFRPFRASSEDRNADRLGSGFVVRSSGCGGVLNRSPESNFSADSDNGSAGSMQGGSNSSDSRSRSPRSPSSQTQPQVSPFLCNGRVQLGTSTQRKESAQTVEKATEKVESDSAQSCPTKTEPTSGTADQPASNDTAESSLSNPISTMSSASMGPLPPKVGGDPLDDKNRKPPLVSSIPHLPFVSTTGNGTNGKTITGFLYRYTKGDISIVCVCHGC